MSLSRAIMHAWFVVAPIIQQDRDVRARVLESLRTALASETGPALDQEMKSAGGFRILCNIIADPTVEDGIKAVAMEVMADITTIALRQDRARCVQALESASTLLDRDNERHAFRMQVVQKIALTELDDMLVRAGRQTMDLQKAVEAAGQERAGDVVARMKALQERVRAVQQDKTTLGALSARWSPNEHWKLLTDKALEALGWPKSDRDLVADANIATDLVWMKEDKIWYRVGAKLWPEAERRVVAVRALRDSLRRHLRGRPHFEAYAADPHFDNLFTYDLVDSYWQGLFDWALDQATGLRKRGDPRQGFLDLLGAVHHSVQDFYCHANWVQIHCRVLAVHGGSVPVPTWEDLGSANSQWNRDFPVFGAKLLGELKRSNTETIEEPWWLSTRDPRQEGGLQTGRWGLGQVLIRGQLRSPWKHRHPESDSEEYQLALRAALDATTQVTTRLVEAYGGWEGLQKK
jgi:hypothetical protein